jgi:hypothetical protein
MRVYEERGALGPWFSLGTTMASVCVLTGAGVQLHLSLDVEATAAEEQKGHQAQRTHEQQQPREQAHSENTEHHQAALPAKQYITIIIIMITPVPG